MIGRLGSLRVLSQMIAAEQIVGRERNHGACHRQLVRNVVVSRRVNSTVRRLLKLLRLDLTYEDRNSFGAVHLLLRIRSRGKLDCVRNS